MQRGERPHHTNLERVTSTNGELEARSELATGRQRLTSARGDLRDA
jgi:hypothetical protein